MRSLSAFLFLLACAFLLGNCAQVIPPTGGDKDTQPPMVINTSPANYSTNFASNNFYIEFNEFVKLQEVYDQLIISPPLSQRPEIKIKRKGVLVSFDEELIPNTTYTFNFGSSVVDLNEANPAEDLVYVFSTGAKLDSLGTSGRIIDAFTTQPKEGVKVMLYQTDEDSLPMLEKPFYFNLTDEQGNYSIGFMKEGEYKIFALEEENANYLYDAPSEKIGFLDSLIAAQIVDSNVVSHNIRIFREDNEKQFISGYSTDSTGFVAMGFNREPRKLDFNILTIGVDTTMVYQMLPNDSVYLWLIGRPENEMIDLEVSENGLVLDTLRFMFNESYIRPAERYSLELGLSTGKIHKARDEVFITSRAFLRAVDTSKIELIEDSLIVPFELSQPDSVFNKIRLIADFEDDKNYSLNLLPGAITDHYGFQNDTTAFTFGTYPTSHYGDFTLNISGLTLEKGIGILQLISEDEVIRERIVTGDGLQNYARISPGTYRLRLIFDENSNGKWDTGDYLRKLQPEKVIYLPKEVGVRSNWVIEIEWEMLESQRSLQPD